MSFDWKSVGGVIADAAPALGTLIGGPAGGAIGGVIAATLGTKNDPDSVIRELQNNPDAILKLKQLELDQQVKLQELAITAEQNRLAANTAEAQFIVDNNKDARAMQVSAHSRVPAILAILVTFGFFGILSMMLGGFWNPKDNNALLIMLGSLGTSWGAVVNFYFGSSAGSDRKTELLLNQSKK